MALFPSTPRATASARSAPQSEPGLRKTTSLADLKRRVMIATGSSLLSHQTNADQSAATACTSTSTWNKLVGSTHLTPSMFIQPNPSTSSLEATSTLSHLSTMPVQTKETLPVKAFLRLRPRLDFDNASIPNIEVVNDHEVVMLATPSTAGGVGQFNMPRSSSISSMNLMALAAGSSANLGSAASSASSSRYTFDKVFDQCTSQDALYTETALPLVRNLLGANASNCMESALIFAYGVSGSGKTHTVQGDIGNDPGLMPRALDTILRSINARHTRSNLRPCRLYGLELEPKAERLQSTARMTGGHEKRDLAAIELSDGFEYSVWCSYAEIYNEKIYDLFDTSDKRKALSLKVERSGQAKFIAGLRQVRVWSSEDAQSMLTQGLANRKVFATKMNAASSRSHSIFTVAVLRLPINTPPEAVAVDAHIARLSIVDLAGSERQKHSDATGDRIKEAGSINKSLMVLNQCMEVLRKNQEEIKRGRKPAIVPFRHSKLTELFAAFFNGDGQAVLVAAINPYQTIFDENQNVLRFAGTVNQVSTTRALTQVTVSGTLSNAATSPSYMQPLRPGIKRGPSTVRLNNLASIQESTIAYTRGDASLRPPSATSMSSGSNTDDRASITKQDYEEDISQDMETHGDELSDAEDASDDFMYTLVDEIRQLKHEIIQLRADHNVAIMVANQEIRDAAEQKMQEMDIEFNRRIADERDRQDDRLNRKIEILQRAHAYQMEEMQLKHQTQLTDRDVLVAERDEVIANLQQQLSQQGSCTEPEVVSEDKNGTPFSSSLRSPSTIITISPSLHKRHSEADAAVDENNPFTPAAAQSAVQAKKIKLRVQRGKDADALAALQVPLEASAAKSPRARTGLRRML